jgi:hypothetical protein
MRSSDPHRRPARCLLLHQGFYDRTRLHAALGGISDEKELKTNQERSFLGRQDRRAGLSEKELRKSEHHDSESVGGEVLNRTWDCFPTDDLGIPE